MIQIGDTIVVHFNYNDDEEFAEIPICYIGNGFVQIQCRNYRTSINLNDGKFPSRGTRLDELMDFVEYRPINSDKWKKGVSEFYVYGYSEGIR